MWHRLLPPKHVPIYRVSIKLLPDYKHLLQENYVEYKRILLPLLKLVFKILCHVFIVTFGFWVQHFQIDFFLWRYVKDNCFRHQFQILQIWRQE